MKVLPDTMPEPATAARPAPAAPPDAFAVLGLDPQADGGLVELAYWHQVERCYQELGGTPAWRGRLEALNHARALLSSMMTGVFGSAAPSSPAAPPAPDRPWRRWLGAAAAVVPLLTLAVFLVVTRDRAWELRERLGGSAAVLLASSALALLAARTAGRALTVRSPVPTPHQVLCVHPLADATLAGIAHEHLRRRAARLGDLAALAGLERAYALIVAGATPSPAAAASTPREVAVSAEAETARPTADQPSAPAKPGRLSTVLRTLGRRWRRPLHDKPPPSIPVEQEIVPREQPRPIRAAATLPDPAPEPAGNARAVALLRVMWGDEQVTTIALEDGAVYTIGSGDACDIRLAQGEGDSGDEAIAAEQARLTVRHRRVRFHHLAGNGGSLVNGERVTWAVLEPGDCVSIGPYQCRLVESAGEPRAVRPDTEAALHPP